MPKQGTVWLHVKSDHLYKVLLNGFFERYLVPVVIYQGCTSNGTLIESPVWVRPEEEFLDGRFVQQQGSE